MDELASCAFDELDFDEIERAALSRDDLGDQTEAAYTEIERQLVDAGVMTPETAAERPRLGG